MVQRRAFGADDRPACSECKAPMHVSRRTIHPTRGEDYEYQTLTCQSCGHKRERTIDREGRMP
jgi:RNase P subunit RPR2